MPLARLFLLGAGEEFNLALKNQEAASIARQRAFLLQDAAMVEELQAAKDQDEQLIRMRAHRVLMSTLVNEEKAEEAAELVSDLAAEQQVVDNVGSTLLTQPQADLEVDDELAQMMAAAAPAAAAAPVRQQQAAAAAANPAAVQQASRFLPCVPRRWARSPPPGPVPCPCPPLALSSLLTPTHFSLTRLPCPASSLKQ